MRKPLLLIACLATTACSDSLHIPFVYRIDINQGNIFDQEMVNQLKPGMTKRQVGFVMGTPLVEDVFHKDRWDYIYSNEPGGEERVEKKFTVYFENDELVGLEGDMRPDGNPNFENKKDITVNIPKIDRAKTVWESLSAIFND